MTKITQLMFMAAMVVPGTFAMGNEVGEAVKHPVRTYDKSEMNSHAENAATYEQKMKEVTAQLELAQRDLASASNDKIKEQAQDRVNSLQKEYDKLAKKAAKERKAVDASQQDLRQDNKEISERAAAGSSNN